MIKPFYPPHPIQVECLYTLHYFQFACGYIFTGEQHDFWEMVYIDRGEADIGAGNRTHRLGQGQVIFHRPNEFHSIWANASQGTNILVVTFGCRSPAMEAFWGRIGRLTQSQRRLMARMVEEGQRAFGPVLDVPWGEEGLPQPQGMAAGSAQMVELLLTQLLLEIRGDMFQGRRENTASPSLTEEADFVPVMERITHLMQAHPNGTLRFEDICREAGVSATVLKERFKAYTGSTVMAYYQRLRVEESRRLLRKGRVNISQVAVELGYSSPQAFSRQFKRLMGVCPVAYLRMIKG